MTIKEQTRALQTQADHYHNLAKDIALDLLKKPEHPEAARLRHTAQMHLVRAESFRTSIKLITGQTTPVSG